MTRWLGELATLQREGFDCIVVTVTGTRGSVPRETGTRMLVTVSSVLGTIGGGNLEHKAIEIARGLLVEGCLATTRRFPLGASLGQCCGGSVNLLFEAVVPAASWVAAACTALAVEGNCVIVTAMKGDCLRETLVVTNTGCAGSTGDAAFDIEAVRLARKRLTSAGGPGVEVIDGADLFVDPLSRQGLDIVLFGAGHVGRALVKILAELDCRVKWVDSREHEFPKKLPLNVERIIDDCPQAEVKHANAGSYFLVMTHSHALDLELSEAIMRRGDFAYFGLIGSLTKRRLFEKRMHGRGIGQERFASMTCPIGSGALKSKEPMAIAVAVAAELIGCHERTRSNASNGLHFQNETQALARLPEHVLLGRRTSA